MTRCRIQCVHCGIWVASPIQFGSADAFFSSTVAGNLYHCGHCGRMTGCNPENVRFVDEDAGEGFVGMQTGTIAVERAAFTGQEILLDGSEFHFCTFTACTLVYRGGTLPVLSDNTFTNCRFLFGDAAERTLAMLEGFYHGGLRPVAESFVDRIRRDPTSGVAERT